MIYFTIMAVLSVGVLALTPSYVLAQKDGPCVKSLTLKMICATGYLIVAVLGIFYSGGFTPFRKILFGAVIASYLGDLFLHMWKPKNIGALGFLGFFSAHFFFIAAFYTQTKAMLPETKFFTIPEIIIVLCFDIFFLIFAKKTGIKLEGLFKIPIVLYGTAITTMFCKAGVMAIAAYKTGLSGGMLTAVIAPVGALNFVASDFTISMLMFNEKHKTNIPLKMFNMFTYFIAELLLALLMVTVK